METKSKGEAARPELRKGSHVKLGRDRGVVTAIGPNAQGKTIAQVAWDDGKAATHHEPGELTPVE